MCMNFFHTVIPSDQFFTIDHVLNDTVLSNSVPANACTFFLLKKCFHVFPHSRNADGNRLDSDLATSSE